MTRRYAELTALASFDSRFDYLRLDGVVAQPAFGVERYLNQRFYMSYEWKQARRDVIARDEGCDLGVPGRIIHEKIVIHHMNPMIVEDLIRGNMDVLDPEYLITTTHRTHNAIHFGDETQLARDPIQRRPGDTKLW